MLYFIIIIALFVLLMPLITWCFKMYIKFMMVIVLIAVCYWGFIACVAIDSTSHSIHVHQSKVDNALKDAGVVHVDTAQEAANLVNKKIARYGEIMKARYHATGDYENSVMEFNEFVIERTNGYIAKYGEENAHLIKYQVILD